MAAPSEKTEEKLEAKPAPVEKKVAPAVREKSKTTDEPWYKDRRKAMLAGGGAVALLAAVAAGTLMMGGGSGSSDEVLEIPDLNAADPTEIPVEGLGQLAEAERALAEEARTAGIPNAVVDNLVTATDQLAQQLEGLQALADDPAQAAAATSRVEEIKRTATAANVDFANALLQDANSKAQRISASVPAGNPSWQRLSAALAELRATVESSANMTDPVQALGVARTALAKSQAFAAALPAANAALAASKRSAEPLPQAPRAPTAATTAPTAAAPAATTATAATTPAATPSSSSSSGGVAAKRSQLSSIVSSGRSMAKQVIKMGDGGNATQKENARLAKNYDKYLANVGDSARGASTDRDFDELIKKANQTKAYIVFLHRQSSSQ